MKKYICIIIFILLFSVYVKPQVNPVDSATVWNMWMTWNPSLFQSLYPQQPFIQNGNSAVGVAWGNGKVIGMQANQNQILQGTLPSSIQNLTELTLIDVRGNPNLTGTIPSELGSLAKLKTLYLNDCGFSGDIPPEIGYLSNLVTFTVGNHGIGGNIPQTFQNLNKLQAFMLYRTEIKGNLPGYFGLLDTLSILWIYDNSSFGGILTDSICLSHSLQDVILSRNAFYGALPVNLGNIPTLLGLDISHNNFTGAIPQSLFPPESNQINLTADSNHLTSLPFICSEQSQTPPYSYIYHMRVKDVRWNKLQFGDFENTYLNGCSYCIQGPIAPQDSVWSALDTTVLKNTTVTLNSTVTGLYNTYYWYKNGVLLDSTTNGLLIIPGIQYSDSGVYTCNITNQYITPLTFQGGGGLHLILNRYPIMLHVADTLSGIPATKTNLKPELYPNPTDGKVTILSDAEESIARVMVSDITGRNVYEKNYVGNTLKTDINLYFLPEGTYMVTVRTQINVYKYKLMIKK